MSSNLENAEYIEWDNTLGKQARGRKDNGDFGQVQHIRRNYIVTQRGPTEDIFYIPKYIASGFDGRTLWFDITEEQIDRFKLEQLEMLLNLPKNEQTARPLLADIAINRMGKITEEYPQIIDLLATAQGREAFRIGLRLGLQVGSEFGKFSEELYEEQRKHEQKKEGPSHSGSSNK